MSMYSKYMPASEKHNLIKNPDFDVLSENALVTAEIVKERLRDINVKNVKIISHPPIGELVAEHYELRVGNDTVAFIYEPQACHSYNTITYKERPVKIATIDTMLSFYLAFIYLDRPYYDVERILCMSKYLFEVQARNRLAQKGLLRRFSINCVGHQPSMEEMRMKKGDKFKELSGKRDSREFEEWFLNYKPVANATALKTNKKSTSKQNVTKRAKKSHRKTKKRDRWLF